MKHRGREAATSLHISDKMKTNESRAGDSAAAHFSPAGIIRSL